MVKRKIEENESMSITKDLKIFKKEIKIFKRKFEENENMSITKRLKKFQEKEKSEIKMLYYCFLHDNDEEICSIYECEGKGLYQSINLKNYIK